MAIRLEKRPFPWGIVVPSLGILVVILVILGLVEMSGKSRRIRACEESCLEQGYNTSRLKRDYCECAFWEPNELKDWDQ
jgi:hypothetical protein